MNFFKKSIIITIIISMLISLASCSFILPNKNSANKGSADENKGKDNLTEASIKTDTTNTSGQGAAKPADTGLTLEQIRNMAEAEGYETNDDGGIWMSSYETVKNFTIVYEDENSGTSIPVYELKNADDAFAAAEEINKAGYNICIVNGKFLTATSAKYGIPENYKQASFLEKIMEAKVMEYTDFSYTTIKPAKDFAQAYIQIDTIQKVLDEFVNKSILLHDKTASEDENITNKFITFYMLGSVDLAFVAALSEDQTQLDAISEVWEMFGVEDFKLEHNSPHNYTLSGKRQGEESKFNMECKFDTATGSLSMRDVTNAVYGDWYEYVPLGDDKYAFQTLKERAIVEYKDGKITGFIYSLLKENSYNPDTESIYAKKDGISEAWVSQNGEDNCEQFLSSDGLKIKIAANRFFDGRFEIEIEAHQ